MKIRLVIISIFISFGILLPLLAQEKFPEPVGFINDFAELISREDKNKLETLFSELQNKTTAEIAVVTIETTQPLDIETYAVKLFEKWGIGKKGKDNGLLLLVALKDRKVRIEVGYGLEGAVPDVLAKQIISNTIIPYFKKGNYSAGIVQGSQALVSLVAKEYGVSLTGLKDLPPVSSGKPGSVWDETVFLIFFILFFGFWYGLFWWSILTRRYRRKGGFWYGSGFGGSSGGFSGGFGGFGGGSSGGGGASGGW